MAKLTQQELERHLWGAADILRGTVDAGDYKQYIFGLLFYKRLCDVWDEEFEALLAETGDREEAADPDEHRFHIPTEHRWEAVRQQSTLIGQRLNNALAAIEDANLRLRGVFGSVDFANQDRFSDALLEKLLTHFEKHRLRNADLEPAFLLHWLVAQRANLVAAAGGSTFKELSRGTAKLLPILLPPILEQRRIAEVLRSVDDAIAAQTALCLQLRQTTDDLADELYAHEIAERAHSLIAYGDACETVQVGIVVKPASYYVDDGGVPALRSTNIRRNQIDFSALVQLSQKGHEFNRKSSLRAGDVVTIRTGEPGKTAVIPPDAPSPLNCIDIIFSRPKPHLRPHFAAYFINSSTARRQILGAQGEGVRCRPDTREPPA